MYKRQIWFYGLAPLSSWYNRVKTVCKDLLLYLWIHLKVSKVRWNFVIETIYIDALVDCFFPKYFQKCFSFSQNSGKIPIHSWIVTKSLWSLNQKWLKWESAVVQEYDSGLQIGRSRVQISWVARFSHDLRIPRRSAKTCMEPRKQSASVINLT